MVCLRGSPMVRCTVPQSKAVVLWAMLRFNRHQHMADMNAEFEILAEMYSTTAFWLCRCSQACGRSSGGGSHTKVQAQFATGCCCNTCNAAPRYAFRCQCASAVLCLPCVLRLPSSCSCQAMHVADLVEVFMHVQAASGVLQILPPSLG